MSFSLLLNQKYSQPYTMESFILWKRSPGIKYAQAWSGKQRRWEPSRGAHIHDLLPLNLEPYTPSAERSPREPWAGIFHWLFADSSWQTDSAWHTPSFPITASRQVTQPFSGPDPKAPPFPQLPTKGFQIFTVIPSQKSLRQAMHLVIV